MVEKERTTVPWVRVLNATAGLSGGYRQLGGEQCHGKRARALTRRGLLRTPTSAISALRRKRDTAHLVHVALHPSRVHSRYLMEHIAQGRDHIRMIVHPTRRQVISCLGCSGEGEGVDERDNGQVCNARFISASDELGSRWEERSRHFIEDAVQLCAFLSSWSCIEPRKLHCIVPNWYPRLVQIAVPFVHRDVDGEPMILRIGMWGVLHRQPTQRCAMFIHASPVGTLRRRYLVEGIDGHKISAELLTLEDIAHLEGVFLAHVLLPEKHARTLR